MDDTASWPGQRATTVLLVAHSPVERRLLAEMLDAEADVRVVGEARTGREAVSLAARLQPDCLLLDAGLPGSEDLALVAALVRQCPAPLVAVTGARPDAAAAALAAGAADVVPRPDPPTAPLAGRVLARRLRAAAVRGGVGATPGTTPSPRRPAPSCGADGTAGDRPPVRLVVVGASTGGPPALARLLAPVRSDFPVPVLVVQHMAHGFVEGLADWLDTVVEVPVVVARPGSRLRPGVVTLAPSSANVLVSPALRVSLGAVEERQWHVPSVDAAFTSVAAAVGAGAVGVLLTGMGRDGATGLRALRDAGAWTLAQDEATSVVYGMPRAAVAAGGVCEQLGIEALAARVQELTGAAPGARPPAGVA